MEAETYLSSGFGVRAAIESKPDGWQRLGDIAHVWMPGRLKGIQVSSEFGVPFLSATQVYDVRPLARKWLSLEKTADAQNRFIKAGMILVTCSGSVGRPTLAYEAHENILISHDLLRVEVFDERKKGWLYAYLHTAQAKAMATGMQYGHIIKHLETSHLKSLPIPDIDDSKLTSFSSRLSRILELRNISYRLVREADDLFAAAVGPVNPVEREEGYSVRAAAISNGRRRFEASYYAPRAAAILCRINKIDRLRDLTQRVWWMPRFKRFYGNDGIPYLSADELFTVNPAENKRILVAADDNHVDYFVERGWIIMACSGQVYGLIGEAALMTDHYENVFFSHDLIRIIVDRSKVRSGYLLAALTHRTHGRPLLIRMAYGTSIPHLEPSDVADFPVVRLDESEENSIADLMEAAANARSEADAIEREIAKDATAIIDQFIAGAASSRGVRPKPASI